MILEEHGLCRQQLWRLTFFHASRLKLGIHDCLRLLSRRRLIPSSPSGTWVRGCDPAGKVGHGAGGGAGAWRAGGVGVIHSPGVSGPPSPASQADCDGESVLQGGKNEGGREGEVNWGKRRRGEGSVAPLLQRCSVRNIAMAVALQGELCCWLAAPRGARPPRYSTRGRCGSRHVF